MSFTRRALLGFIAGLPFALKAGASESPDRVYTIHDDPQFLDPAQIEARSITWKCSGTDRADHGLLALPG